MLCEITGALRDYLSLFYVVNFVNPLYFVILVTTTTCTCASRLYMHMHIHQICMLSKSDVEVPYFASDLTFTFIVS